MYQCIVCSNLIELNNDLVKCSGVCKRKYHRKCTSLSEKEFEVLNGSNGLSWNCDLCSVLCNENFSTQVNRLFDEKFGKFFINNERQFEHLHNRLKDIEGNRYIEYPTRKINNPPTSHPHQLLLNRKAVIITGVITLLTILTIVLLTTSNIFKTTTIQKNPNEDTEVFNGTLQFVSREEWQGRPHKGVMDKLKLPVHRIIISHTASDTCYDRNSCAYRLQVIQAFHMDSMRWDDIGYNFLIGADGLVYIGRGWDNQGAHTKGYNSDSIGVTFVGTFTTVSPNKNQLAAAQLLIAEGVRLDKLVPDYRLYGARQFSGTESPGNALYQIIQTWPNWSAKI